MCNWSLVIKFFRVDPSLLLYEKYEAFFATNNGTNRTNIMVKMYGNQVVRGTCAMQLFWNTYEDSVLLDWRCFFA